MTDEIREVSVIAGPYSGKRLTMPAADAETAINDHWARDPYSDVPYGEGHEPLSEEERGHAVEAANAWANTTWAAANIPGAEAPPPEGGEGEGGTSTITTRQGDRPEGALVETSRQRMQREQRENAERAAREQQQRAEQEQQQRAMQPDPNQPGNPGYRTRGPR